MIVDVKAIPEGLTGEQKEVSFALPTRYYGDHYGNAFSLQFHRRYDDLAGFVFYDYPWRRPIMASVSRAEWSGCFFSRKAANIVE